MFANNSTLSFGGDAYFYLGDEANVISAIFDNSHVTFNVGDQERSYKGNISFANDSTLTIKTKYNENNKTFGSIKLTGGMQIYLKKAYPK